MKKFEKPWRSKDENCVHSEKEKKKENEFTKTYRRKMYYADKRQES